MRVAATEFVQDFALFARFHAFGDEVAIECSRHRHDDADQGDPAWAIQRLDETSIEFDLVKLEGQQRPQIRIAGTEIIECHVHADRVATRQELADVHIVEHQTLGDFQLESIGRQIAIAQMGENSFDEFRILELAR